MRSSGSSVTLALIAVSFVVVVSAYWLFDKHTALTSRLEETVRGTVYRSTGVPIAGATVDLTPRSRFGRPISVVTDREGRFEIGGVRPGLYGLTASHPGLVPAEYGQQRPFEPGGLLEIPRHQVAANLRLVLTRGGAITGAVTDAAGRPIAAAVIAAGYLATSPSARVVYLALDAKARQTDSAGRFRLTGVPPGDYVVSATRHGSVDEVGSPGRLEYGRTYSHDSVDAEGADRIRVQEAAESTADIKLTSGRPARLSGTVRTAENKLADSGLVRFFRIGGVEPMPIGAVRIGRDGRFAFNYVFAPGRYMMAAVTGPPNSPGEHRPREFGSAEIEIGRGDKRSITIRTRKPISVHGRVVLDTALGRISDAVPRIYAVPVHARERWAMGISVPVAADGTFHLTNFAVRSHLLADLPAAGRLRVRRILLSDGTDVTVAGVSATGENDVRDIAVLVDDEVATIRGHLTDPSGKTTRGVVIALPAAVTDWQLPGAVRAVAALDDGSFIFPALGAGKYGLVGLATLDLRDGLALDNLRRFNMIASPIEVTAKHDTVVTVMIRKER